MFRWFDSSLGSMWNGIFLPVEKHRDHDHGTLGEHVEPKVLDLVWVDKEPIEGKALFQPEPYYTVEVIFPTEDPNAPKVAYLYLVPANDSGDGPEPPSEKQVNQTLDKYNMNKPPKGEHRNILDYIDKDLTDPDVLRRIKAHKVQNRT